MASWQALLGQKIAICAAVEQMSSQNEKNLFFELQRLNVVCACLCISCVDIRSVISSIRTQPAKNECVIRFTTIRNIVSHIWSLFPSNSFRVILLIYFLPYPTASSSSPPHVDLFFSLFFFTAFLFAFLLQYSFSHMFQSFKEQWRNDKYQCKNKI